MYIVNFNLHSLGDLMIFNFFHVRTDLPTDKPILRSSATGAQKFIARLWKKEV